MYPIDKYGSNCDYLREKFSLRPEISIYEIVDVVVTHLKDQEKKSAKPETSQKENKNVGKQGK